MTTPRDDRLSRNRFRAWVGLIVCIMVVAALNTWFLLFGSPSPEVTQIGIIICTLCGAGIVFCLMELRDIRKWQ